MTTYKSFAVIGAGTIGLPIVEVLLSRNASVVVLTRPGSSKSISSAAKVVPVDVSDKAALTAIFKEHKVEVLISAVPTKSWATQKSFAEAAKEAGVNLFVPSEFGIPTAGHTQGGLAIKDEVAKYSRSIGLPTARFYTGFFSDQISWLLGIETGNVNIVGKGDTGASFTAIEDIAGFTAYVLTTLPPSKLTNSAFRLEGELTSRWEFLTALQTAIENGRGSSSWDEVSGKEGQEISNKLWEGHKFTTIKETLGL